MSALSEPILLTAFPQEKSRAKCQLIIIKKFFRRLDSICHLPFAGGAWSGTVWRAADQDDSRAWKVQSFPLFSSFEAVARLILLQQEELAQKAAVACGSLW